jgi:hypothetical protein
VRLLLHAGSRDALMDWVTKAFLKTSLAWLGLGVTLGVATALYPPLTRFRTAHLPSALEWAEECPLGARNALLREAR